MGYTRIEFNDEERPRNSTSLNVIWKQLIPIRLRKPRQFFVEKQKSYEK